MYYQWRSMAWKNYRLNLSLLLFIISSSAGNYSAIQKGTSPGDGGAFYYGINGQTNLVCPVGHTILQPTMMPRLNGSFYVEGLDAAEEDWFTTVHVVEPCWLSPSSVAAAKSEHCDQLYIIRRESPAQRGYFSVLYNSSRGAYVITRILYGPEGVSLINYLAEDGTSLLVDQETVLRYELRIRAFTGQSSSTPILCEKTQSGEFSHSSAFYVLHNSQTPDCLSSLNEILYGFSVPYITRVVPGNLSYLFSDPTTIYLAYGSCNFTSGSLTSSIINITTTDSHTDSTVSTAPRNTTLVATHPSSTTLPATSSTPAAVESTIATVEPTTADDTVATSAASSDVSTTSTTRPIVEATHVTTDPGSTHIATSLDSNPLHLRNWATFVSVSVVVSVVLMVFAAVFLMLWKTVKKCRRKTLALSTEEPEVKFKDGPPALTIICSGLDTDSGVVDGSTNGTPLSDRNFILNGPDCSPPSANNSSRESGLTDSSASEILKTVHSLSKTVRETKIVLEDVRDTVYAGQLVDNSNDQIQEESG